MPQIIIQARTPNSILGAVTLKERVVPIEQQNDHYIAQLIERVSWALIDAEQLESQTNNSPPGRADARQRSLDEPSGARTTGLAKNRRGPTRVAHRGVEVAR